MLGYVLQEGLINTEWVLPLADQVQSQTDMCDFLLNERVVGVVGLYPGGVSTTTVKSLKQFRKQSGGAS